MCQRTYRPASEHGQDCANSGPSCKVWLLDMHSGWLDLDFRGGERRRARRLCWHDRPSMIPRDACCLLVGSTSIECPGLAVSRGSPLVAASMARLPGRYLHLCRMVLTTGWGGWFLRWLCRPFARRPAVDWPGYLPAFPVLDTSDYFGGSIGGFRVAGSFSGWLTLRDSVPPDFPQAM